MATADRETAAVLVETDDSDEETLLLTHVRPAAPNCTPAHAQEAKEQLTGCPAVLMAGEVKVPLNEYKDSAKDEAGNAGGKGPPMCALKDRNRACPWDTKYCKRWKFCTAAQEAKELREVEARAGAEMLFPLLETAVWEAHAELLRERAGGEREGADTERPAGAAGFAQCGGQVIRRAEDRLRMVERDAARLGEDEAPAPALEQAMAERGLQRLDLGGEGRLRQVQPPGGTRERSVIRHRPEEFQVMQVHSRSVSWKHFPQNM